MTCAVSASKATCSGFMAETEFNPTGVSATSEAVSTSVIDVRPQAITVTAGVEKLTGGAAGSSPTDSAPPNSSGGGSPPPQRTSSSTGGVPRITQQAVLAGVAAVVGGVMMV
jgi:hypothetical protein